MRYLLRCISFHLFILFVACGGGSGGNGTEEISVPDFSGIWLGRVQVTTDNPCADSPLTEVEGQLYRFEVTVESEAAVAGFGTLFVVDSFGNAYSGPLLPESTATNELDFQVSPFFGGEPRLLEQGPDTITFRNLGSTTLTVELVYFGGFRGCVDIYEGEFFIETSED